MTLKNYPLKPIAKYRCPNCRTKDSHAQQIVEWGIFEWMRHHSPRDADKVWENMHIGDAGWYHRFLVGNMALHRNSFMVISDLRGKLPGVRGGRATPVSR